MVLQGILMMPGWSYIALGSIPARFPALRFERDAGLIGLAALIGGSLGILLVPMGLIVFLLSWGNHSRLRRLIFVLLLAGGAFATMDFWNTMAGAH